MLIIVNVLVCNAPWAYYNNFSELKKKKKLSVFTLFKKWKILVKKTNDYKSHISSLLKVSFYTKQVASWWLTHWVTWPVRSYLLQLGISLCCQAGSYLISGHESHIQYHKQNANTNAAGMNLTSSNMIMSIKLFWTVPILLF